MTDGIELLRAARKRAEARCDADVKVDYNALNKMVRRQRSALTRAINSNDIDKLVRTIKSAVDEWDTPGSMWPDDWSRWQRALDDALPFHQQVDICDL